MLDHLFIALLRATDAHSGVDIIRVNYHCESFLDGGKRRGNGERLVKQFLACFILKCLLDPPLLPGVNSSIRKDGLTVLAILCYTSMFLCKISLKSRLGYWTVSRVGNTEDCTSRLPVWLLPALAVSANCYHLESDFQTAPVQMGCTDFLLL